MPNDEEVGRNALKFFQQFFDKKITHLKRTDNGVLVRLTDNTVHNIEITDEREPRQETR